MKKDSRKYNIYHGVAVHPATTLVSREKRIWEFWAALRRYSSLSPGSFLMTARTLSRSPGTRAGSFTVRPGSGSGAPCSARFLLAASILLTFFSGR